MKLSFYGGAQAVTGANYLLETDKAKILVDCGLFQGPPELTELNYLPFPFDPKTIDFVFITHSHLDHCGRLAKLVKDGFRGQIFCTPPTRDIMDIALADATHLMEEEAQNMGREPLYAQQDLDKTFSLIKTIEYNKKISLSPEITFAIQDAGHILGSGIIELWLKEKNKKIKIVFSGDLGNPPTPLLKPTAKIKSADYLIIESAYGDRLHESKSERKNILQNIILETIRRRAVLMIPSFAIERTQELLSELNDLVEKKLIPAVPIYIDSPLAIKITAVYRKYEKYFNKNTQYNISSGDDIFNFPGLQFTASKDESKEINRAKPPKIIIAGSGMSTGGRILFHEKEYLPDPKNIFLVIGFQVEGSLGRKILQGDPLVSIFGQNVNNRAESKAIGSYSAHADQKQLFDFVKNIKKLKKIFIVQGEKEPGLAFKKLLNEKLNLEAEVPIYEQAVDL